VPARARERQRGQTEPGRPRRRIGPA
jgi:hypothetical protein